MSNKTLYYIATFVGSIIGGYIPTLWGADFLSITSLIFSTIGAIAALVITYKIING